MVLVRRSCDKRFPNRTRSEYGHFCTQLDGVATWLHAVTSSPGSGWCALKFAHVRLGVSDEPYAAASSDKDHSTQRPELYGLWNLNFSPDFPFKPPQRYGSWNCMCVVLSVLLGACLVRSKLANARPIMHFAVLLFSCWWMVGSFLWRTLVIRFSACSLFCCVTRGECVIESMWSMHSILGC